jgi:hypothetical protein
VPSLSYVGLDPSNSPSSVVTKAWTDGEQAAVVVSTAWVNSAVSAEAVNDQLQPQSYVDSEDALRAHKTAVDTADQSYVPIAQLGAARGVAVLDSNGDLLSAEIPAGVLKSRSAVVYTAAADGSVFLPAGQSHQCGTQTYREFCLASIVVPDPGYPWRPQCFAVVGGYSNGGAVPTTGGTGTGNMGLLTVIPPSGVSDTIYAIGVCSALYQQFAYYPVLPAGASGQTPLTVPPINGSLELDLWASCYTLTGYVFWGSGMWFQVQVIPAM